METANFSENVEQTYDPRRLFFDQHMPLCLCVALRSCWSADDSGLLGYGTLSVGEWFSFRIIILHSFSTVSLHFMSLGIEGTILPQNVGKHSMMHSYPRTPQIPYAINLFCCTPSKAEQRGVCGFLISLAYLNHCQ